MLSLNFTWCKFKGLTRVLASTNLKPVFVLKALFSYTQKDEMWVFSIEKQRVVSSAMLATALSFNGVQGRFQQTPPSFGWLSNNQWSYSNVTNRAYNILAQPWMDWTFEIGYETGVRTVLRIIMVLVGDEKPWCESKSPTKVMLRPLDQTTLSGNRRHIGGH